MRRDRAQLRDRDREVGEELEQERLELVVGAVDLVDQQHDLLVGLERLEQRPPQQELAAEELARGGAGLGRADREQLALVVPVVDRVVEVDALVALQPDQARAERAASARATSVLPTPASPSSSSGCSSVAARNTAVARPRSGR